MTSPWSPIYLFIYLLYFKFFLTDPWPPILDPSFPVNLEILLIDIVLFLQPLK